MSALQFPSGPVNLGVKEHGRCVRPCQPAMRHDAGLAQPWASRRVERGRGDAQGEGSREAPLAGHRTGGRTCGSPRTAGRSASVGPTFRALQLRGAALDLGGRTVALHGCLLGAQARRVRRGTPAAASLGIRSVPRRMTTPARPPRPVARSRRRGARTTVVPRWTPPSGPPPRRPRGSPNHPTGAAERQRQGGRLELKIEASRAPTLMRDDVDVHRALLAAPKEVGAKVWPYTPRGRAALPAGESGAARVDSRAAFHRARARACFGGKATAPRRWSLRLAPARASASARARSREWRTREPCPTTQPGRDPDPGRRGSCGRAAR
jgi:hypothetical protein